MLKKLFSFFALAAMTGCFSLEPFYFMEEPLEKYLDPEYMKENEHYRGIIPSELIAADSFQISSGFIYGFWALHPGDTLSDTTMPFNQKATILYSHGNSGNINGYWDRVELLWEMGYRVYIYDYPGFGRSDGAPSSENCLESAKGALARLLAQKMVDTSKIVFYGYSLGGYMTTYLASDVLSPGVVILESAPASTRAFMKDSGLLGLPGGIVSGDDFDSEKRIANIGCPLLMMHGRNDSYVVFEHNALALWELANDPKDSFWVEGAGHGDVPYVAGDEYSTKVKEFIDSILP